MHDAPVAALREQASLFRLFLLAPENIARTVSDNCISRLATALVVVQFPLHCARLYFSPVDYTLLPPSRSSECYYFGAFNRKGGVRGQFREIGASTAADFKCLKRERIKNLIRDENEDAAQRQTEAQLRLLFNICKKTNRRRNMI